MRVLTRGCFSKDDIRMLFSRRLAEVRAVTRTGNYSVHRVRGKALGVVLDRAAAILPDVRATLAALPPGQYTPLELDRAVERLLWSALGDEGMID